MATIIIAGYTVPVLYDSLLIEQPIKVGSESRAFDGTARTTVRAIKFKLKFTSRWIAGSLLADLRASCQYAQRVAIGGDFGGFYGIVTIGTQKPLQVNGAIKYQVEIGVEEF